MWQPLNKEQLKGHKHTTCYSLVCPTEICSWFSPLKWAVSIKGCCCPQSLRQINCPDPLLFTFLQDPNRTTPPTHYSDSTLCYIITTLNGWCAEFLQLALLCFCFHTLEVFSFINKLTSCHLMLLNYLLCHQLVRNNNHLGLYNYVNKMSVLEYLGSRLR